MLKNLEWFLPNAILETDKKLLSQTLLNFYYDDYSTKFIREITKQKFLYLLSAHSYGTLFEKYNHGDDMIQVENELST